MKLKVLFNNKGEYYLATESGEILGNDHDREWIGFTLTTSIERPTIAKIIIETTKIEYISATVDGSVASNALPEAPRALPTPRCALPDPEYIEARLDQLRRPFFCDEEEEWEDEEG